MTGPTHIALGVSTVWLMCAIPGAVGPLSVQDGSSPGLLVGCAALGALLPDLDATRSTVKYLRLGRRFQQFLWPARVLSRELGHRGPLHSLAGITLLWVWLGLPAMLWLGWRPALALALGMLSHLLGGRQHSKRRAAAVSQTRPLAAASQKPQAIAAALAEYRLAQPDSVEAVAKMQRDLAAVDADLRALTQEEKTVVQAQIAGLAAGASPQACMPKRLLNLQPGAPDFRTSAAFLLSRLIEQWERGRQGVEERKPT